MQAVGCLQQALSQARHQVVGIGADPHDQVGAIAHLAQTGRKPAAVLVHREAVGHSGAAAVVHDTAEPLGESQRSAAVEQITDQAVHQGCPGRFEQGACLVDCLGPADRRAGDRRGGLGRLQSVRETGGRQRAAVRLGQHVGVALWR